MTAAIETAFQEGYQARRSNMPRTSNPYDIASPQFDWWLMGWDNRHRFLMQARKTALDEKYHSEKKK